MAALDHQVIPMLVAHHAMAIAMAQLAMEKSQRPEIRRLAERIITAQSAEHAQMRLWYRQRYGTDLPASGPMGHGSAIGPGHGMGSGMGCGLGIDLLNLSTSTTFDRAFLEQMIPHHAMGVMMASAAQFRLQTPELRKLLATIVTTQSQEIVEMQNWFQMWFGSDRR